MAFGELVTFGDSVDILIVVSLLSKSYISLPYALVWLVGYFVKVYVGGI